MIRSKLKIILPLLFVFVLGLFTSPLLLKSFPSFNNHQSAVPSSPLIDQTSLPKSEVLSDRTVISVIRVIDGDTIEIKGGQKVRYIGIDTPEVVDPRKPIQCFGEEASLKNKELVEGKEVRLEKDVSETDKYGRLLRYVYIEDPSAHSINSVQASSGPSVFVNDYLVRQGYAHASSYPPDVKYQEQFVKAQEEAQSNNKGLWGKCQNSRESGSPQTIVKETSDSCQIKGNISSSGEKIYHMPGQYYYEKTVIDESRGERWFCSEDEAVAAGWRKSKK